MLEAPVAVHRWRRCASAREPGVRAFLCGPFCGGSGAGRRLQVSLLIVRRARPIQAALSCVTSSLVKSVLRWVCRQPLPSGNLQLRSGTRLAHAIRPICNPPASAAPRQASRQCRKHPQRPSILQRNTGHLRAQLVPRPQPQPARLPSCSASRKRPRPLAALANCCRQPSRVNCDIALARRVHQRDRCSARLAKGSLRLGPPSVSYPESGLGGAVEDRCCPTTPHARLRLFGLSATGCDIPKDILSMALPSAGPNWWAGAVTHQGRDGAAAGIRARNLRAHRQVDLVAASQDCDRPLTSSARTKDLLIYKIIGSDSLLASMMRYPVNVNELGVAAEVCPHCGTPINPGATVCTGCNSRKEARPGCLSYLALLGVPMCLLVAIVFLVITFINILFKDDALVSIMAAAVGALWFAGLSYGAYRFYLSSLKDIWVHRP